SPLLRSSARFTSVIIATPDGQIAVSLWQRGGVPEFTLSVEWRSQPEQERAVRQFFSTRGLSTSHDYLAGNGGGPDATRCLGYFLPPDVQYITALTRDVLCEVIICGSRTLWISVMRSTVTLSNPNGCSQGRDCVSVCNRTSLPRLA